MFLEFFYDLRAAGLPVGLGEYLSFVSLLAREEHNYRVDDLYLLARTSMVKHESHYDRFDQAFGRRFRGLAATSKAIEAEIPQDWLEALTQWMLDPEALKALEAAGRKPEDILKEMLERLKEQKERHSGGSKWIGTGGRSPYGNGGLAAEGIRVGGQDGARRALKVWERREFRNLDDTVELGTRNFKLALRRLRSFVREGRAEELDLDETIRRTARNAGLIDIAMRPERRNRVRLIMLIDIGGSMDDHIEICEQLFSAARSEFSGLEHYYFHNCPYENLWKGMRRDPDDVIATSDFLALARRDHRLVFLGDAAMNPYEILEPYGSVEHMNEESGQVWLRRIISAFDRSIWLNPSQEESWSWTASTRMVMDLMAGRMFDLSISGLDRALRELMTPGAGVR